MMNLTEAIAFDDAIQAVLAGSAGEAECVEAAAVVFALGATLQEVALRAQAIIRNRQTYLSLLDPETRAKIEAVAPATREPRLVIHPTTKEVGTPSFFVEREEKARAAAAEDAERAAAAEAERAREAAAARASDEQTAAEEAERQRVGREQRLEADANRARDAAAATAAAHEAMIQAAARGAAEIAGAALAEAIPAVLARYGILPTDAGEVKAATAERGTTA